jgi:hypothetical protein
MSHGKTGFHAYWIYCTIKHIHFKSTKYDIVEQRLPRKEQFIKSWNEGRKDKDGLLFHKLMELLPYRKDVFIRCMAYYYMQNPAFHVSEILNDNLQLFAKYELELGDIETTVKSDYLNAILHCHERDVPMKQMFYGYAESLPYIFTLYDRGKCSIHSLVAFNLVFHLFNKVRDGLLDDIDIVRRDKCKNYATIFDKYAQIVYNYYTSIDWKDLLQTYHYDIMQRGPNAT